MRRRLRRSSRERQPAISPARRNIDLAAGAAVPRLRKLLIIALLNIACALFGCGSRRATLADRPIKLVFKHAKHPQAAHLAELIRRFEGENPRIHVREEVLPSSSDEQHQFYVINLAAHSPDVDVLDLDIIWVQEFARAGWLQELTSQVGTAELAPLNPAALAADWLDSRLYALPWFADAGVLYYRKDLLTKYGIQPPRTYEDLVTAAREVLAAERNPQLTGFIWQGMQYEGLVCVALEFIRGNGGVILGDQQQPVPGRPSASGVGGRGLGLNDNATLDALRFMRDLEYRYKITPPLVTTLSEESTRYIFQSGRAVFMRNWPYAWNLMNRSDSPVAGHIGITIVPHFERHESVPTLGGFHLGVNAYSRHKEEATAFVRFMIRYASQKEILLQLGVLPAHMQVYGDPEVRERFPWLKEVVPTFAHALARPVTPYYPMISQILQPQLSAVISGIRSPSAAMQTASSEVRHMMGQP